MHNLHYCATVNILYMSIILSLHILDGCLRCIELVTTELFAGGFTSEEGYSNITITSATKLLVGQNGK